MSMEDARACPAEPFEDAAIRYLQGRLSPEEGDTFEAHFFGCDQCWAEVQKGLEVLAAGRRLSATPRAVWRPWPILAAAAVLTLAVAATLRIAKSPGSSSEMGSWRGSETKVLELSVESRPRMIVVRWTPVPKADVYSLEMFQSDGRLLLARETANPSIEISRELPELPVDTADLRIRVKALDELRQVVGDSGVRELAPAAPR